MLTLKLYENLCKDLPKEASLPWDNDGISVLPYAEHETKRALIALDVTDATVKCAIDNGFDAIITHHPMIFRPVASIDLSTPATDKAARLIRAGIAAISFHTRLDAAEGGTNSIIADMLGLENRERFGHKGEEIGIVGDISAITYDELYEKLQSGLPSYRMYGMRKKPTVSRVAICTGSGGDMIYPAIASGADVLVTGEMKYHDELDAADLGLSFITAGHFETEAPVLPRLKELVLLAGAEEAEIYKEQYAI